MPHVRENMQGVAVTREALKELGESLSALAQPVPEPPEHYSDWDAKLAAIGPRLVDVCQMQYQIGTRTFNDGPTAPLDESSFEAWPPLDADITTTKFHVFIPEVNPSYPSNVQVPYVQVEGGAYGWANVWAWADTGETAARIIDTVTAVLRNYPATAPEYADPNNNTVFVGHGGDRQWEVVRDYLLESGFNVEAFESDERAGLNTLDVVGQMIRASRVAVIVMTAADLLADGQHVARPNVIHEIGFAQGALGVPNTIILLEEGTQEFTNIAGLTQIRFRRGEIHTTKARVLTVVPARSFPIGGC